MLAQDLKPEYDLVMLSCKAYDLEDAIASFAPAVGPQTTILPLLNGVEHVDILSRRFGAEKVLGGLCQISSTLDAEGRVLHMGEYHVILYGERDGSRSPRIEAMEKAFSTAKMQPRLSANILQEMWEKWVFIVTAAGMTSLMRGTAGDITAAGGEYLIRNVLGEATRIAADNGFPPSEAATGRAHKVLLAPGATLVASMMRDIERGGPIETDHLFGALLRRARPDMAHPMIDIVLVHLKTYEIRRAREAKA